MINVKIIKKPKNSSRSDSGSFGSAVVGKETNNILSTLQSLSVFSEGLSRLLIPCDDADKELSWEQAFETDAAGEIKAKSLKATVDLWSVGGISALGKSGTKPEGGISYGRLDSWSDYDSTKAGYVLSAALGYGLKSRLDALPSALHNLIVKKNGTTIGTYKPDAATVIDITDVASAADLLAHTANNALHITAAERTLWNNKVDRINGKGLSTNDFTTELLNKLNGIEAGAHNYIHPTATATVIAAGNGKVLSAITVNNLGHITSVSAKTLSPADIPSLDWSQITSGRPTTLAGYGITDAKISGGTITLGQGSLTPLTAHQPIYNLTFSAGPFSAITYNPKSMAQVVNIPVSTNHITEGDNLYFTNQRAVAALKTITDNIINSIASVNTLANTLSQMFIPYAGDTELTWAAVSAGATYDSLKANGGVWTESFISALGKSAGGSGGSGGGSFGLMKVWPTTDPGSGTTDALGANLGWELRQDVLSLKSGSALSVVTAGSGNAITDIVKSGTTVTATKGATFLTQHQPLDYLNIKDVRDAVRPPTYFDAFRMSAWFNATGMPTSAWYSGIHMKGWSDDYASWQLAANSTNNTNVKDLYFRVGINATWEAWQKVLTDANYSSVLNSKYVTLDTPQTITADKTFNAAINIITNNAILFPDATTKRVRTGGSVIHGGGDGAAETDANLRFGSWYGVGWYNTCIAGQSSSFAQGDNAMWLNVRNGHLYVQGGYHVKGGTSSQFLKADGSVDSNSYALASALGSYYTKAEVDTKDKRLTTYYASRPTSANVNFGNNTGLYTFLATSAMTTGKPANDAHILHMEWDNSLSWAAQLALLNNGGVQYRYQSGTSWQAWRTLLDTSNYAYILDGRYYTESESDGRFAKLASPNDLVHSGNEITMIPNGFSRDLWFNYRAVGGTGHIEYYYMGDGNAGFAGVAAKGFVKYGSSNDYILLGGGGHKALSDITNTYVKKTGDTMTGALTVPRININAAGSDAHFTAGNANNIYASVGGKVLGIWNASEMSYRASTDYNGQVYLGSALARWANVYATTINVTSTALVANLNADLLDGYHGDDYFKRSGQFVSGADALQQFGLGVYLNATGNGAGNTNFPESYGVLSIFSAGTANYTLRLHAGTSKQLKYQIKFDSVNSEWMTLARITDNVASATKLQTARTIWGQSFNGTANVSGALTGVTDIIASGDIKAKRLSLNNGTSYIEWDAANNAYKVNGNFYATGGSSCLGFNYLSATEVSVGTLNADIVKGNTLAIGGHALIMASDDALAFIHGSGGIMAFGSTIQAYEGIILGDGSYTIDEVGVASLSDVSVVKLTINNAVFTVSGNEIYVTIGSTRYKLTKTTA